MYFSVWISLFILINSGGYFPVKKVSWYELKIFKFPGKRHILPKTRKRGIANKGPTPVTSFV